MSVFGAYSHYYDMLYKDKDYLGEVNYVHSLISKYQTDAKSILDLGCGTGRHALLLAEKGYSVTGVDISSEMVDIANLSILSRANCSNPTILQGDITEIRFDKTFDVIISLFHVMSYQVTNDSLHAVMKTVKHHLKNGGVFIFDCWYGPAVLTDRPVVRIKRLENDEFSVTRIAEPFMHPNDNVVDVNYHVYIKNKSANHVEELKEKHQMRYLFKTEIELFLKEAGMRIVEDAEWMTGKRTGFDTWAVCFVAHIL